MFSQRNLVIQPCGKLVLGGGGVACCQSFCHGPFVSSFSLLKKWNWVSKSSAGLEPFCDLFIGLDCFLRKGYCPVPLKENNTNSLDVCVLHLKDNLTSEQVSRPVNKMSSYPWIFLKMILCNCASYPSLFHRWGMGASSPDRTKSTFFLYITGNFMIKCISIQHDQVWSKQPPPPSKTNKQTNEPTLTPPTQHKGLSYRKLTCKHGTKLLDTKPMD